MENSTPETLDDLFAMMTEGLLDGYWDDLPTFDENEPANTLELWSWDKDRVIVGSCANDIQIVDRKEWSEVSL